ncbi:MAG: MlaE family lipid ABC transporter permease subunit [Verrucomicrobiaceae bacterium]|nr:MAG: MlaE family lipid ABC transporter permease subunit [Verrucomicrobiaceae bacterium]
MDFNQKTGCLKLGARLDAGEVSALWSAVGGRVRHVDASPLETCDGAGLALIWYVQKGGATVTGLRPEIAALLRPFDHLPVDPADAPPRDNSLFGQLGRAASQIWNDTRDQVAFIGEFTVTALRCAVSPGQVRWGDMWVIAQRAGVDALIVAGMVSLLTGMIMAFQSSVPLKQFGVDIFVVNLVALAILRELGPIMTAVVLAGRSGSAFAAEIGTMKVNEEIDALVTMGIEPMRFLVVPRVLAGFLVTPVLTVYANFLGVAGGFFVMMALGFPFMALWNQLVSAVGVTDVMTGTIKSFVFGILVAGVGCLRGLQTGTGASAVGVSTTRAVVSGIFLIVLVDAVFAAIFYTIQW